jgi:hypothetical protein
MTRHGKIARLPEPVREELNARLEKGEEGAPLLRWLNARPEVKEGLKEQFDGAPITKQNLSEWRLGGWREWQMREDLIAEASRLSEGADALGNAVDTPALAGALAGVLAARYAALLNGWDGEPDPKFEEKVRLLRGLNHDLALLQKTLHRASQQNREAQQALEQDNERELEKEKARAVAPIMAKVESDAMEAVLGGGELGRQMAQCLAATKYNLPPPKDWKARLDAYRAERAAARRAQSKHAQASPTGNDPDQPSPGQSNPVAPN